MRIGVLGHFFVEWTGGFDFLRLTMESLLAVADPDDQVSMLLPIRGPRATARRLARRLRDRLVRKGPNYPTSDAILRACAEFDPRINVRTVDRGLGPLRRFCRREGIDVVLPSTYALPPGFGTPWVGYIGDFQHKHLPHFFTAKEMLARDAHFGSMLNSASSVMVNSHAVASDADTFFPGHRARKFVLPFGAALPRVAPAGGESVRRAYGIEGPYFVISNQFWLHKDHATAFRAFALLAAEFPALALVCTGETSDPRDPAYFPRLMAVAEALGIRDRLKVLGLVPKADQLGLLKSSVAAVQPTLSEGGPGGGVVFDAVGLGVPVVMSDIAVNREIDEPGAAFFRVGDATDLARAMRTALLHPPPRQSDAELVTNGQLRRLACGRVLLDALAFAMSSSSGPHPRG